VKTALQPLSTSLAAAVGDVQKASLDAVTKVESAAEDRIIQVTGRLEDYSKRLGELEAAAGRLERELSLARIIFAALVDPASAADFPIDWVRTLVDSALLFCRGKSFSPVVEVPMELVNVPNCIYSNSKASVIDLLRWAMIGFPSPPSGGRS